MNYGLITTRHLAAATFAVVESREKQNAKLGVET